MSLTDSDKLWIAENTPREPRYQMTYMVGPINVTVRLDTEAEVVPSVERLVSKARDSQILNAKESIPAAQEQALKAKCKTCQADMILKSGVYKSGQKVGQSYQAFFCPNAVRGDYTKHKAIFL